MPAPHRPELEPGQVYRTKDLAKWATNPSRLAKRLVKEGKLKRLAQGLYLHPRQSRFGAVPADDGELMRAFLEGTPYNMTGPDRWNSLGLSANALFSVRVVYNTKRSGEFTLGGRTFLLRRVKFPEKLSPEWFVVDLIEHHDMAGVSLGRLEEWLSRALGAKRFRLGALRDSAFEYGTQATQALVDRAAKAANVTV